MDTTESIHDILEDMVENYIPVEGSELGDYWSGLYEMWHHYASYCSPEFRVAMETEIRAIHDDLQKNWKVVEGVEEVKFNRKTVRLVRKDEE